MSALIISYLFCFFFTPHIPLVPAPEIKMPEKPKKKGGKKPDFPDYHDPSRLLPMPQESNNYHSTDLLSMNMSHSYANTTNSSMYAQNDNGSNSIKKDPKFKEEMNANANKFSKTPVTFNQHNLRSSHNGMNTIDSTADYLNQSFGSVDGFDYRFVRLQAKRNIEKLNNLFVIFAFRITPKAEHSENELGSFMRSFNPTFSSFSTDGHGESSNGHHMISSLCNADTEMQSIFPFGIPSEPHYGGMTGNGDSFQVTNQPYGSGPEETRYLANLPQQQQQQQQQLQQQQAPAKAAAPLSRRQRKQLNVDNVSPTLNNYGVGGKKPNPSSSAAGLQNNSNGTDNRMMAASAQPSQSAMLQDDAETALRFADPSSSLPFKAPKGRKKVPNGSKDSFPSGLSTTSALHSESQPQSQQSNMWPPVGTQNSLSNTF